MFSGWLVLLLLAGLWGADRKLLKTSSAAEGRALLSAEVEVTVEVPRRSAVPPDSRLGVVLPGLGLAEDLGLGKSWGTTSEDFWNRNII